MDLRESFRQVTWLSLELTISMCPIVENMAGSSVKLRPRLIVHTAPRAHQSNCAQGSSVELRPGLIRRSAPGRIRRTAPGRKWTHPVPKYTWMIRYLSAFIVCRLRKTSVWADNRDGAVAVASWAADRLYWLILSLLNLSESSMWPNVERGPLQNHLIIALYFTPLTIY